jgi:hypothetical protein
MFEDSLGRAAQEQVIHRAVTVRAHHDQIGVKNIRLIQNFFGHRSSRLVQTDLHPPELAAAWAQSLELAYLTSAQAQAFPQGRSQACPGPQPR